MFTNNSNTSLSVCAAIFPNSTTFSGNTTFSATRSTAAPSWDFPIVSRTILCILGISLNSSVIVALLPRRKLWTSFTVYMIVLLGTNTVYCALLHPLAIIRQLYVKWWLPSGFCTLYLYLIWVFYNIPLQIHMNITINRIWAVAFPISYRQYHSKRVACTICLGSFVYVHVVALPLVLIDQFQYWNGLDKYGCSLNYDVQLIKTYSTVVTFLLCVGPAGFVIFAYPFIYFKQTQRRKVRNRLNTNQSMDRETAKDMTGGETNDKSERKMKSNSVPSKPSATAKDGSRPFVALTLLTTGAFICWTPMNVYFILLGFVLPPQDIAAFLNFAVVLYALMPILDPIIFAASLRSVRSSWGRKSCLGRP